MERSLLAGLSLSVTVALAALHGIAPDTPKWAIALPAWFAGVMLWSNANRRTRTQAKVLFGIGIVATLWGTVRGGSVDLGAAIGANALLLTRTEPVARLQPRGWYALWSTLLGVHLFGAVINLSIVFIMGDRLSERGALSPRQVMVLTRAFSACAFWSPFFAGMAGGLWAQNALVGKVAGVFASTGSQHGGHEATLLSTQIPLQHFGMLIAGLPYSFSGQTSRDGIIGGAPYGAGTIAGADGTLSPTATDLAGAQFQGAHVADLAARLAKAPSLREVA